MPLRRLDGATDEWVNEWVDRQEMPKSVRVEMVLRPERKGAVPVIVTATANLPAPATQPPSDVAPESPPPGPGPEETPNG